MDFKQNYFSQLYFSITYLYGIIFFESYVN